jgi:hypothetical protein
MRTGKFLPPLAAVIAVFCCSVLYGAAEPPPADQSGQALADIRELNVSIEYPDDEPNIANLPWKEIQDNVEKRLKGAGLKIASEHYQEIKATAIEIPELVISVEARIYDSQRYVLHVQSFLSRVVYLAKERRLLIRADVWKSTPEMLMTPVRYVSSVIPSLLANQVLVFVNDYSKANPAGVTVSDVNTAGSGSLKAAKERAKPAVEQPAVEYKYVSSKNGEVFHKAGCASAKRISPGNLVGYNSRDEAIQADKRPCKQCKP